MNSFVQDFFGLSKVETYHGHDIYISSFGEYILNSKVTFSVHRAKTKQSNHEERSKLISLVGVKYVRFAHRRLRLTEIASVAPLPRNDISLFVIASEAKQSHFNKHGEFLEAKKII
jgi:hypothetical protein